MKIDNSFSQIPGSISKGNAGRSSAAGEKAAPAKASGAPQDSVQLRGLSTNADAGAPVDTARVEAIKLAISEGRFKINHEAIADGLIASAKALMAERSE